MFLNLRCSQAWTKFCGSAGQSRVRARSSKLALFLFLFGAGIEKLTFGLARGLTLEGESLSAKEGAEGSLSLVSGGERNEFGEEPCSPCSSGIFQSLL